MAGLPDLIEIVAPKVLRPLELSIPGSKSITNRALILAALAQGKTRIEGALWSEDTQVMVDCLKRLGFEIETSVESEELSNRTIVVAGKGGIPAGGSENQPLELFVGNAGTAARFLSAMLCLGTGAYRLSGVPRMHERPQSGLFEALRQLGYRIDAPAGRLPALIHGAGPRQGSCKVSIRDSSQFASALLLSGKAGGWSVGVEDENAEEAPYVVMTREMVQQFPSVAGTFLVEPDASSASYFVGADYLLTKLRGQPSGIRLRRLPRSNWQVDARFSRFLPLPDTVSRSRDLGDSILTAMIVAPFEDHPVRFEDLGRLRVQECERVAAMRVELTRCGARVQEEGDTLTIYPSAQRLQGAEVETYNDHRIAMCFAVLGLVVPGMRLRNPACVNKTFPNFFEKLAALGAASRDAGSGETLQGTDLLAD